MAQEFAAEGQDRDTVAGLLLASRHALYFGPMLNVRNSLTLPFATTTLLVLMPRPRLFKLNIHEFIA